MSAGDSQPLPVEKCSWVPGNSDIAVVMISLNESHNMTAVLDNLKGWAREVFLVDNYSQDDTVDIVTGVR
jgi:hypothetical protein